MTKMKLRNTTPLANRSLPPRYHTYLVIRDGEKVGDVEHSYRPKNAGGSAWKAIIPKLVGDHMMTYTYYSPTLPKLCEIIRHVVVGDTPPPSHWR